MISKLSALSVLCAILKSPQGPVGVEVDTGVGVGVGAGVGAGAVTGVGAGVGVGDGAGVGGGLAQPTKDNITTNPNIADSLVPLLGFTIFASFYFDLGSPIVYIFFISCVWLFRD
jgi:hypothetical protein